MLNNAGDQHAAQNSVEIWPASEGIPFGFWEFATTCFGDITKQQFFFVKLSKERRIPLCGQMGRVGEDKEEEEQQQLQMMHVGLAGRGMRYGHWGSGASMGRKYYLSYLGQSYSLTRKAKRNEGTA